MGSLFFKTLFGGVAGTLAWLLWEPFKPGSLYDAQAWSVFTLEYVVTLAAFIGAAVGGLNGWTKGSKSHLFREAGLGLFFGVIGAGLGMSLSNALLSALGMGHSLNPNEVERVLFLGPLGLFIGAGVGAATLSMTGVIQGVIGGGIAGLVSGLVFNPASNAVGLFILAASHKSEGEIGAPGRAIMAVLLGALIGLFIGLAQQLMRSAWIRLNLGRNEGKEWAIDRSQMLIGRNELANIPLFGDPAVVPQHAYILKHGHEYLVADPGGSPAGVYLNGQRVNQQAKLFHGATIQVGNTVLQFLMKAGRAPAPVVDGRAYVPGGPVQNPYAGQPQHPFQPGQAMTGPQMPAGGPTMMSPQMGVPQTGMQPTMMSPLPNQPLNPTIMSPGMSVPSGLMLIALDGPLAGQRFPVGGGVELGRASAAVPMSYDTEASRRHATVSPSPTGVIVQDVGSTNGTFVNNQRVQNIEARPGDMIRVGKTTFRLES